MFLHLITLIFMLDIEPITNDFPEKNGSILINISNIRSTTGKVNVSLFATADGFPSNPQKAVAIQSLAIDGNQVTLRFDNLPFSSW